MKTRMRMTVVLALLGALFLVGAVLAAPTATTLDRFVIGGGGGQTGAGIYALDGTIGQPVVDRTQTAGYDLSAGFWGGVQYRVYLPLVLRNGP